MRSSLATLSKSAEDSCGRSPLRRRHHGIERHAQCSFYPRLIGQAHTSLSRIGQHRCLQVLARSVLEQRIWGIPSPSECREPHTPAWTHNVNRRIGTPSFPTFLLGERQRIVRTFLSMALDRDTLISVAHALFYIAVALALVWMLD